MRQGALGAHSVCVVAGFRGEGGRGLSLAPYEVIDTDISRSAGQRVVRESIAQLQVGSAGRVRRGH
jgi:hypothetical protein